MFPRASEDGWTGKEQTHDPVRGMAAVLCMKDRLSCGVLVFPLMYLVWVALKSCMVGVYEEEDGLE